MKVKFIAFSFLLGIFINAVAQKQPNIIVILADDMGYGEVQALNPEFGKIKTPNLDKVAKDGLVFTDGHSGSSVCTPTRYGLITGRYAWRTRLQSKVLSGGNSLVAKETLTIADLLKDKGYYTAMFGKWHLGMLFDGVETEGTGTVKPGAKVTEGPIDAAGFDEFHGFHYARQMDLWIDNDVVTKNIEAIDMLPELTKTAVNFIETRKGNKEPFFMYIPWNAPHSPVVPSKEWQGKSGLNDHADFVMQTDDSYGQVIQALKDNDLWENTLVIYSADNGTSKKSSGYKDLAAKGHKVSAHLKGYKAEIYDGGHRVPFMATWPKHIKKGRSTDEIVCLTDLLATAAEITDYKLSPKDGVDSNSFLYLLTDCKGTPRTDVIHHDFAGRFAIRNGQWKLIIKSPNEYELFDMINDVSETTNVIDEQPEIAKELRALLEKQINEGRSTFGKPQKNDTDAVIVIEKPKPKKKIKKKKDGKVKKGKKDKKGKKH